MTNEAPASICPRCGIRHLDADFRGQVCGWCADDLDGLILRRRTPRDLGCDGCALDGRTCPGIEWHCQHGEHCTSTDAACAAEHGGNVHPPTCCTCKAVIA